MIDIKNFTDKEAKGLTDLVRITADSVAVYTKNFDSETGIELAATVVGGNIQEYKDKKVELLAQVAEIDVFIKKFEALIALN